MTLIIVFLALFGLVILLWIFSRQSTYPADPPAPTGIQLEVRIPEQGTASLLKPITQHPTIPVVMAGQENQLQGQGILLNTNGPLPDQFISRPSNTLLLADAPPEVQQELLSGLKVARLQGIDVPAEFDCRNKWPDLITIPMDQGSCGSCWAFASATAVSDRFRIADPNNKELRTYVDYTPPNTPEITYRILNNLSPYELIYCDLCGLTDSEFPNSAQFLAGADGECNQGCEGGFIQHTYRYIKEYGISSILCENPTCDPAITHCPCDRGLINCNVYKPSDVYAVTSPTDPIGVRRKKIQEDVYQYGPVTAAFSVYKSFINFFELNPDGIYTRRQGAIAGDLKQGGHAVDIVGWGSEPTFYWLVRNSWSPVWGEDGFFKIQYDFGGILDEVMAAEI